MNKPKFDPSKPFEEASEKPKFDPTQAFESVEDEKFNPATSAIRKFAQGASAGFSDELAGGVEALGRAAGLEGAGGDLTEIGLADDGPTLDWEVLRDAYRRGRQKERENLKKDSKDNPITSGASELAGAIVSPVNKIAKGMSLTKGGATIGGITGLGQSEGEDLGSIAYDTGKGVVIGGVIGKATDAASPLIQKGVQKISEGSKNLAERFAARALGAERGTIKKLGQDKVQEIGRYALDENLLTPLSNTDDVIARNAAKQAEGAAKMNEVYSAIDDAGKSSFNPLEVAAKVDDKIGDFYRSPINKGETNQLENTLESILMRGNGNIPLKEAQALKQELGKVANWKNNVVVTDKEKMARDAYGVISSQIDEAVEQGAKEIGSEGLQNTLAKGKELFGNSKGAEELLTNKLAREQGNKLLGLTDYGLLGGGAAATLMSGGTAAIPSLAMLGAKKGLEKYGAQTSALALDKISKTLMKSPELAKVYQSNPALFQKFAEKIENRFIGSIPQSAEASDNSAQTRPLINKDEIIQKTSGSKYQQVLQNAAQKGDASFNAAHYVLSTRDPQYRKQVGNQPFLES